MTFTEVALKKVKSFKPSEDHPMVLKRALVNLRNELIDDLTDEEIEPSIKEIASAIAILKSTDLYWKLKVETAIEEKKSLQLPKKLTEDFEDYDLDKRVWSTQELKNQYGVK